MTDVTHIAIPDEAIGQAFRSVSALVFDVPEEDGPACREAICLHFDSMEISIRAMTDTSELCIDTAGLDVPNDPDFAGCHAIANISHHPSFQPLIGKPIRNWWSLTNDAGYNDGFMIAFSPNCAVCFIAMNNEVHILDVSGEQCS